ncbi:calcium-activated chloride channel regulator 1-like [Discoglossus pictus]
MVKLNDGGYEDILIGINPSVIEDIKIIDTIQNMVKEASNYLFHATKKRLFIKSAKILIPLTWSLNNNYRKPQTETYDKADVIIANPFLKYGNDPYTLQYGGCGEKGRYIHLTPDFLLKDGLIKLYGPRDRVFVHEWSHLRWGVFDEYNHDVPYYFNGKGDIEATRCSLNIHGKNLIQRCNAATCTVYNCTIDTNTGLYEDGCAFVLDKNQVATESIMYLQSISTVTGFCDASTHNTEAPTLQNRLCNYRSTWDVIMNSTDIKSTSPRTNNTLPVPSFTLLQSRDRIVTLVLDVSGSMSINNRIGRLYQAAEVFLIEIIELNSHVGIVEFSNIGSVTSHLLRITNLSDREQLKSCLPKIASGGTNICLGIQRGLQVNKEHDGSVYGTEIILVTDGQDNQDTKKCFSEIRASGTIIHTIAIGPTAEKVLEEIADMTGGRTYFAPDNIDPNDLIDAFSGVSSGNGDISSQAIQRGPWHYSLCSTYSSVQSLGISVTSKAASADVPPVIVNAHMNVEINQYPNPMVVYASVSQGLLPIKGAKVTATIEPQTGSSKILELFDNGAGADIIKNDGTYSRYFTAFSGNGRYSLKVRVEGKKNRARLTLPRSRAHYIPGYIENGVVSMNPPRPVVDEDDLDFDLGPFSRTASGGSFVVSNVTPNITDIYKPEKITDLVAKIETGAIILSWTATGDDLDEGMASRYDLRMSKTLRDLRDNFDTANSVNISNLKPQEAGSSEIFTFVPENIVIENGTILYFALVAFDDISQKSDLSNIAQAALLIPAEPEATEDPKEGSSKVNITAVALIVSSTVANDISAKDAKSIFNYNFLPSGRFFMGPAGAEEERDGDIVARDETCSRKPIIAESSRQECGGPSQLLWCRIKGP